MGFDVAAGASQKQLNQVAAAVFEQVYPNYFKGSIDVSSIAMRVDYDVPKTPVFNLTPTSSEQRQELADAIAKETGADKAGRQLLAAAVDAAATFAMDLPEIKVTLTSTQDQKSTDFSLSARAICQAQVDPATGQVFLNILRLSFPSVTDKTAQFLLDHVVTPKIQQQLDQYLAGVRLPALNVEGVQLSTPLVVIQDGRLIVLASLKGSGTPAPESFPWPDQNFFTVLSPATLNAAAQVAVRKLNPEFHDKGGASVSIGVGKVGINWNYDLSLNSPNVSLNGDNVAIGFQVSGGAGAGAYLDPFVGPKVQADLGVHFSVDPNPSGEVRVQVDSNNNVILGVKKVNPFGLKIGIDGFPSWLNSVIGWVTQTITSGITNSVVPLINQFIQGLQFSVYQIPAIPIDEGAIHLMVSPSQITTSNRQNMLVAAGNLNVTRKPSVQLAQVLAEVAATKE